MRWPAAADEPLVRILRMFPGYERQPPADAPSLFARAELHRIAGVVHDTYRAASWPLDAELERRLATIEIARQLDHAAHLDLLHRLDAALAAAGLRAVILKGALFAERYYPRPSARATTDVDLLVEERDLDAAAAAIGHAGYEAVRDASEARFRREHHHLHFVHPRALPLELHFHAYRGFGHTLRSEPLLARSRASSSPALRAIRVLAPEDELVFLAVHAAAHRFVRLAWLFDMRLLLAQMSRDEIEAAGERARGLSYGRPAALAATLLVDVLGVEHDRVRAFGQLGALREPLLRGVVGEPESAVLRSATRLVYTAALCDSPASALRYASAASRDHAARLLARR
jgi:hypothetical protein